MLGQMGLRVVLEIPGKPCEIQFSEDQSVVATLMPVNNLYFLDLVRPEDVQAGSRLRANVTAAKKPISVWHRRLGHLNLKYVRDLSRVALGVDYRNPAAEEWEAVCEACIQGKQSKKPLVERKYRPQRRRCPGKQLKLKPRRHSKKPFDLIHSDVCGPFPVAKDKSRYFITFIQMITPVLCR